MHYQQSCNDLLTGDCFKYLQCQQSGVSSLYIEWSEILALLSKCFSDQTAICCGLHCVSVFHC